MSKVFITNDTAIKGRPVFRGQIEDVSEEIAATLRSYGKAERYDPEKHLPKKNKEK
jgi:hypothetical protein